MKWIKCFFSPYITRLAARTYTYTTVYLCELQWVGAGRKGKNQIALASKVQIYGLFSINVTLQPTDDHVLVAVGGDGVVAGFDKNVQS